MCPYSNCFSGPAIILIYECSSLEKLYIIFYTKPEYALIKPAFKEINIFH